MTYHQHISAHHFDTAQMLSSDWPHLCQSYYEGAAVLLRWQHAESRISMSQKHIKICVVHIYYETHTVIVTVLANVWEKYSMKLGVRWDEVKEIAGACRHALYLFQQHKSIQK